MYVLIGILMVAALVLDLTLVMVAVVLIGFCAAHNRGSPGDAGFVPGQLDMSKIQLILCF